MLSGQELAFLQKSIPCRCRNLAFTFFDDMKLHPDDTSLHDFTAFAVQKTGNMGYLLHKSRQIAAVSTTPWFGNHIVYSNKSISELDSTEFISQRAPKQFD
jgi:hypothetical protein